jgi:hypothetical protein
MMHGRGKSDSAIVAGKPTNNAERSAAEPVEPRAEAKGNAIQQSTGRAQERGTVSQALERIRQAARERKKEKFTALLHHVNVDLLEEAFGELKADAASGVDGVTWQDYEQNLERNLEDLHARVQRGAYRALPSRRVYIPKPDGRQRPLAVSALEDKIVQRATAMVLNAIYEGCARYGGAVRRIGSTGNGSTGSPRNGSRNHASSISGPSNASPSGTQGRSRMPESGTYGSVRGALSNERPYRDSNGGAVLLQIRAILRNEAIRSINLPSPAFVRKRRAAMPVQT